MSGLDWGIVGVYLAATMVLGLWLARRASGGLEDFFVGGRTLPWWLAGASMAATTFSIDTPLYVTGVVGERGVAGNWEWWSFAISHVLLVYVFARLWRRSEVVTDNELSEIRYAGRPAAVLRGTKGFLFAVVIGSIGIGLAMLAMVKVLSALQVFSALGFEAGGSGKLWAVVLVSLLVLAYSGAAGLWGVVVTDFFQLVLGLIGAIVVAWAAVAHVGGLAPMVEQAQALTDFDVLAFTPIEWTSDGLLRWSSTAGITASTFFAYTFLQWWSFRRSDGGGEFVQRLVSVPHEPDAVRAAWLFTLLHYVVRTWPWVLVGVVALVIYPDLQDRELAYPMLMLDFLPAGLLGLVVASLVAAFMSTVSTLVNWSASYVTNDLYFRFVRPEADSAELVRAARVASVAVTALGAAAAFLGDSVAGIFQLVIAMGTGPGLVLILRWFWWRINAWAELSALVAGILVGAATGVVPALQIDDFGVRLFVTAVSSLAVWVPVMLLTPPEPDEVLDDFYRRVRPGGPGWRRQRERTGLPPAMDLGKDLQRVVAALLFLFGCMFSVGSILLLRWNTFGTMAGAAAVGAVWLVVLGRPDQAPPSPEPPTHRDPAGSV